MSLINIQEIACKCNSCKGACKTAPCFGTPEDIMRIIANGHSKRLKHTIWISPFSGDVGELVSPIFENGRCTFLDKNDEYEIHHIKPTEGKLIHHSLDFSTVAGLRVFFVGTWKTGLATQIINQYKNV